MHLVTAFPPTHALVNDLPFDTAISVRERMAHDMLEIAAMSSFYYDHLLTLRQEIKYIWGRAKTQSSYYFLFNRYFSFFSNLGITIVAFSNLSDEVE
ncbi:hypothetical protein AN958_02515 [Leucoagaricus sp. SymC.cos]|nr:hypothetical protein AN958_02515 [Leucoagaricus sp. SymC.cos]